MSLFSKQAPAAPQSPRAALERKYASSRANLWLVVIASFVNLFMVAFAGSYFLFAPSMPTLFVELTLLEAGETGAELSALIVPLILGVVMTLPYLLCAIFAKKHVGWMIAALAVFSVDCCYLLFMYELTSVIIDIVFHAWIMFYLITGVINGFKLKNTPEEPAAEEYAAEDAVGEDPFDTFRQNDFYNAPAEEPASEDAPKTDGE